MNATAFKLLISIWQDDQAENPSDWDGWKAYSFSRRHGNHADPEDIGFEEDDEGAIVPSDELKAKLESGLAFFLDYYEHGQCMWSLTGTGPRCQWDSVRGAGLLVWEGEEGDIGAKSYADRETDAKHFIDRFTEWCNGEVYGYSAEALAVCCECGADKDADTDLDLPSCSGFFGSDIAGMVETLRDELGSDWSTYDVRFKDDFGGGLADECATLWKKGE